MSNNECFSIQQVTKNNKSHYIHKKTKKKISTTSPFITKLKKTIRIPPAYKNVVINDNLDSKILAKGEDAKGRIQYIYNPEYVKERSNEKFKELIHFSKKIHLIRKWMNKTLNEFNKTKKVTKNNLIACCLFLIDECNFRVGNTKYYDLYESSGVTTLCPSHIKGTANHVIIEFKGKKGVHNKSIIRNKMMRELLLYLQKKNKSHDFLFFYNYENKKPVQITEKTINYFLKSYHPTLSVKMFRTWNANVDFMLEIQDYLNNMNHKLSKDEKVKYSKKSILESIRKIAPDFHHSTAISRKSYLHEGLIQYILDNPDDARKKLAPIRSHKTDAANHKNIMNILLFVS